jgi:hypothetical protein
MNEKIMDNKYNSKKYLASDNKSCSMIREIIKDYKIKSSLDEIYKEIADYFDTMKLAYSGFYCILCSHSFHKSLDMKNQKIFVN